jgi:galactose oxidase-like protein
LIAPDCFLEKGRLMSRGAHSSRRFLFISFLLLIALGLVSLTSAKVKPKTSRAAMPPNPYYVGQWEPSFSSGIVVHASVLPNGKVLHWSPSGAAPPTYSRLWSCVLSGGLCNPDVAGANSQDIFYSTTDLFCSGHSFLPDGRLFAAGGSVFGTAELGTAATTIFEANPQPSPSPLATSGPTMTNGRWYPSTVTLGNGETAILSGIHCAVGQQTPCQNYEFNLIPEVLNQAGTSLRSLSTAQMFLPLYPRVHLAADGRVFVAGPNSPSRWLNTAGTGSWGTTTKPYFHSGYPWFITDRDSGSSVMYDVDKVMLAGGGNPPTNLCETIDLKGEAGNWEATDAMQYPRRHLNLTILADGKVLATGGTQGPGFDDSCSYNAVLAAELWNPWDGTGTWTTLASMSNRRQYHSVAVLLIDGRVLVGGNTGSDPTSEDCKANNPVYQQEIFSPPYLFNPDGTPATRPTVSYAPDVVYYNSQFLVTAPNAISIDKVTMVRLSSVTHSFNMNQRINHLTFSHVGNGLRINTPADGNVCPPGHYMLFLINNAGVPSVAKIIKIE